MPKHVSYLAVAFVIVVLDQLSKWTITETVLRDSGMGFFAWLLQAPEKLGYHEIPVWPFFNIVMVWNQGISFGMFNGDFDYGPLILITLSLLITLAFVIWLFRSDDKTKNLGIVLVIGGALGNVIDRLRFGAVIDFLDFHAFGYHWPAFNLADSCIVLGIAILILQSLFFEKKQPS